MADTDTSESQEGTDTSNSDTGTQDGDGTDQTTDNGDGKPDKGPDPATDKHLADLRSENAKWRTKLRKAEKEIETLRSNSSTDIEKARAEARQEAIAEATTEANARIVRAEVVAAARQLQDPTDALGHIDLTQFEVDDKGDVDRKAIKVAVDELVKAKPYLAGTRDPDFGARTPATGGAKDMNTLIKQRLRRG